MMAVESGLRETLPWGSTRFQVMISARSQTSCPEAWERTTQAVSSGRSQPRVRSGVAMMDTNVGIPNSARICEQCLRSVAEGVESGSGWLWAYPISMEWPSVALRMRSACIASCATSRAIARGHRSALPAVPTAVTSITSAQLFGRGPNRAPPTSRPSRAVVFLRSSIKSCRAIDARRTAYRDGSELSRVFVVLSSRYLGGFGRGPPRLRQSAAIISEVTGAGCGLDTNGLSTAVAVISPSIPEA